MTPLRVDMSPLVSILLVVLLIAPACGRDAPRPVQDASLRSAWSAPASLTLPPWFGSGSSSTVILGESARSFDKRLYGFGEPGQANPGGVGVGVYAYRDERAAIKGFRKETLYTNNLRKGDVGKIVPIEFKVDPSISEVQQACLWPDSDGCRETEIVMRRGRYVGSVYVALPRPEGRSQLTDNLAIRLSEVMRSLP